MRSKLCVGLGALIGLLVMPLPAFAQEAGIDNGNTAWILTTTALVLFLILAKRFAFVPEKPTSRLSDWRLGK